MKKKLFLTGIFAVLAMFGAIIAGCAPTDSDSEKTIVSIEITQLPTITTYAVDDDLVLDGLEVTVHYSDGSSTVYAVTLSMISGYHASEPGEQTLTITIQGFTTSFVVTVTETGETLEAAAAPVLAANAGTVTEGKVFAVSVAGLDGAHTNITFTWVYAGKTLEYALVTDGTVATSWLAVPATGTAVEIAASATTDDLYVRVKASAGNWLASSVVKVLDNVTLGVGADTTAPVLSAGSVSNLSSATGTTATLKFTSNEAGTYYYVILASATGAPNAATVKAQGAAVAKGTAAATAGENTINVTGLVASTTYEAYIVVEDAGGNLSTMLTITEVNPVTFPPEDTPDAAIDYVNEKLTGLVSGGKYTFGGGTAVTVWGTTYSIAASWMTGSSLSVVKKGNGTTTTDSAAQALVIPTRPAAPGVSGGVGVITGADTTMEYSANGTNGWTTYSGSAPPGTYYVRIKQVGSNFAGTASGAVTVSTVRLYVGSSTVPVSGVSGLVAAIAWIRSNEVDGQSYRIVLDANETVGTQSLRTVVATGITITLEGADAERIIQLSSYGSLFTVQDKITLVLDKYITLQGISGNSGSLVGVGTGGNLEMREDAKITGNTKTSRSPYGGGVYVGIGGTFTMNGGKISGNATISSGTGSTGGYGGGVSVDGGGPYATSNAGTFTMNSGEISGNTASSTDNTSALSYGGGVYAGNGGTFTMNGGDISGNTAGSTGTISYSYSYGGGVYIYGDFTMTGGTISGNNVYGTSSYGGGVYLDIVTSSSCTFIMNDGEISGNTVSGNDGNGGGVYVFGINSTFTMNDGEISGNTVNGTTNNSTGGGVYLKGTFTKISGTITGTDDLTKPNTATGDGKAVYIANIPYKWRNTTAGLTDSVNTSADLATNGNGFWQH